MAFDYVDARETAKEIIEEFGEAGTFVLEGVKGGYDSDGNEVADSQDVIITGTVTPLLDYSTSDIDGVNILKSDSLCYFHSDTLPTVGMTHTQNGVKYRAQNIETLTSVGGVVVYYEIQLRRG